jgi:acetoin utilization protein AcuB
MLVKAVMTPNPVTVAEDTSIFDALDAMRRRGFSRLLVTRGGKLIGIVTELDLMRVSPSVATTLSIWEQNALLAKMRVKEVMTRDPVTIGSEATVEEAALIMRDLHISGLPVVEEGKIVGIVTERDLFDAFVDLMHAPAPGARLTLQVEDRIGVLAEITSIVSKLGINILAVATFDDDSSKPLIVLKVDTKEPELLVSKLTDAGYAVVHQAVGNNRAA